MTANSTLRILEGLRKNCKDDDNLKKFLEIILSEEIKGEYFWRDYYNNALETSIQGWVCRDED